MNHELSELLFKLFVTNKSAVAIQQSDGRYVTKYIEITPQFIENVLNTKGSLGCYQQIYKSKFLKWICFDFDCVDKENPNIPQLYSNYVKPLTDILAKFNIAFLQEFSGRRGIHVWIIFEDLLEKEVAFKIVGKILEEYPCEKQNSLEMNLDLFPATSSSKGNKVGKQVKLPLSVHKKGAASFFFKSAFSVIDTDSSNFLIEQYEILCKYSCNKLIDVMKSLGMRTSDTSAYLMYKKFRINDKIETNALVVQGILSQTKIYRLIFDRLANGSASLIDRLVLLGTLRYIDEDGSMLVKFLQYSPSFDEQLTYNYISKFKAQYFPATFAYLYQLYHLDIEANINPEITGLEYLMQELGLQLGIDINSNPEWLNEQMVINNISYTLQKEKNYFMHNDEAICIKIKNDLSNFCCTDLKFIEQELYRIQQGEAKQKEPSEWYVYYRKESESKIRKLVSLGAYERILTTHLMINLAYKIRKQFNSFSYNINFLSSHELFFSWFSSWGNYLERIRNYIEINYFSDLTIFVLDIKGFYDAVDFLAIYDYVKDFDDANKNIFYYIVNYNDQLLRAVDTTSHSRIGVPQGPAYARIASELFISLVLDKISENCPSINEGKYEIIRYVDDIVVMSDSTINGENFYYEFINWLNANGLSINKDKSKFYGSVSSLSKKDKEDILHKNKFNYELQKSEPSLLISEQSVYEATLLFINKKTDFDIDDVNFVFNSRVHETTVETYLARFYKQIFSSDYGRGSAFIKFYKYIFSTSDTRFKYLTIQNFKLIPLNTINFINYISRLYISVETQELEESLLKMIIDDYLCTINIDDISDSDTKSTYLALLSFGGINRELN